MASEDWREFKEGIHLFNEQRFWHAHEAWENVWKRRPEESRIFFQGIIQVAAAYHLLLAKNRFGGMMKNFAKAEEKLRLFPDHFLGLSISQLLSAIQDSRKEAERLGAERLDRFDLTSIPVLTLTA